LTAGNRITNAFTNSCSKKFGYAPSDFLRDTNIDIKTFVADRTLKEDHQKLFLRLDNLVEAEQLAMEAAGATTYECADIKDPIFRQQEIKTLKECP